MKFQKNHTNRKLAAYAMQKGFEGSLVWETLKDLAI